MKVGAVEAEAADLSSAGKISVQHLSSSSLSQQLNPATPEFYPPSWARAAGQPGQGENTLFDAVSSRQGQQQESTNDATNLHVAPTVGDELYDTNNDDLILQELLPGQYQYKIIEIKQDNNSL